MKEYKNREYLFDNYKALLILLIVVGHFFDLSYKSNGFSYYFKWIVYPFHIPAFVFISGYFSKKKYKIKDLFIKLVVPYLVFEVVYYLYYTYILHVETGLYLLNPKFTLWYLMCLFVWRLIPTKQNIQYLFIGLSVIAGLLIGVSDISSNYLSIPRMFAFLPFFLVGRWFSSEKVTKLRTKKGRLICTGVFIASAGFILIMEKILSLPPRVMYGRYNYEYLGESDIEGLLIRLCYYIIAFTMLIALLGMITDKKSRFSVLGMRTLPIYIIHGFVFKFVQTETNLLKSVNTSIEVIGLLAFSIFLVILLSLPIFDKAISFISGGYIKNSEG
ncbi:MAG: acyltransferase family protein [Suipraeoptans sp.]